MQRKFALVDRLQDGDKEIGAIFVLRRLLLEVNGSVNVGQVAFLSTAEKIANELRNGELGIPTKLVEELFVLVRNRSMNIFIVRVISRTRTHMKIEDAVKKPPEQKNINKAVSARLKAARTARGLKQVEFPLRKFRTLHNKILTVLSL